MFHNKLANQKLREWSFKISRSNLNVSFMKVASCIFELSVRQVLISESSLLIDDLDDDTIHEKYELLEIIHCQETKKFDLQYKAIYIDSWDQWKIDFHSNHERISWVRKKSTEISLENSIKLESFEKSKDTQWFWDRHANQKKLTHIKTNHLISFHHIVRIVSIFYFAKIILLPF